MEDRISIDEALTLEGHLIVKNNNNIIIDIREYTTLKNLVMTMLDATEDVSINHKKQFNLILDKSFIEKFLSDLEEKLELFMISRKFKENCIEFIGPNMTRVYLKNK